MTTKPGRTTVVSNTEPKTIVVYGRSEFDDDREYRYAHDLGRAIALRGHKLIIPFSKGIATAVREGFASEGGEAIRLDAKVPPEADETIVISDPAMDALLDEKRSGWRNANWIHCADPAAFEYFWTQLVRVMKERGTPL